MWVRLRLTPGVDDYFWIRACFAAVVEFEMLGGLRLNGTACK